MERSAARKQRRLNARIQSTPIPRGCNASRVDLARSSGVWGIVPPGVASVQIVDAARPNGVLAELDRLPGGDLRVFISPVSSSAVTITALDKSGHELAHTVVPKCC